MLLIRGLPQAQFPQGSVVTIGNFDGVHLGHQAVLSNVSAIAHEHQLPAVVVCFEPQPKEYFARKVEHVAAPARILPFADKFKALIASGVQQLCILPFNQRLANQPAEDFVKQLATAFNLKHLIVGDDFRFGAKRQGDFELLTDMSAELGFECRSTESLIKNQARVSSTIIRELLVRGDISAAEHLLSRPYVISGRVKHGLKLGRQLGVPTANLHIGKRELPVNGVFLVQVSGPGVKSFAVANVGKRPTINNNQPMLEVHLLDFDQNLYGERLNVRFLKKLRDTQKFDNLSDLKTQIALDINAAKQLSGQFCKAD